MAEEEKTDTPPPPPPGEPEKKACFFGGLRSFLRSRTPPPQRDLLALALPCALFATVLVATAVGIFIIDQLEVDDWYDILGMGILIALILALPAGFFFFSWRVFLLAAGGLFLGSRPRVLAMVFPDSGLAAGWAWGAYGWGAAIGGGRGLGLGLARKSLASLLGGLILGQLCGIIAFTLGMVLTVMIGFWMEGGGEDGTLIVWFSSPSCSSWSLPLASGTAIGMLYLLLLPSIALAEYLGRRFSSPGQKETAGEPEAAPRAGIIRKLLGWSGLTLVSAVILTFAYFHIWSWRARVAYEGKLAALRAAGEPVLPEDVAPPPVPDEENAAVLFEEAFELYVDFTDTGKKEIDELLWRALNPRRTAVADLRPIYKLWLAPNAPALVKAREALKRPKCRFDLDYAAGPGMLTMHLSKMKNLANQFAFSACRELDEGRPETALEEVRCCLRLTRVLEEEPTLISQLVRAVILQHFACDALEQVLVSGAAGEEGLLGVAEELGRCADRVYEPLIPVLKAERTMIIWMTDRLLEQKIHYGTGTGLELSELAIMKRDPATRGLLYDDVVAGLNYCERLIEAVRRPYWTARGMIARIDEELEKDGSSFQLVGRRALTLMQVPIHCKVMEKFAHAEARLTVLRLACAVEVYSRRHGRLPESLAELAPKLLPEIPRDPFTGRSYIYKMKPGGTNYVIYSVGSDEEDDGGVWSTFPDRSIDWGDGDIVFEREPEKK